MIFSHYVHYLVKTHKLYKDSLMAVNADKHSSLRDMAQYLMQRITESKHHYAAFVSLKSEIEEELKCHLPFYIFSII